MSNPTAGAAISQEVAFGDPIPETPSTRVLSDISPDIRDALSGTLGAPSADNRYVTEDDLAAAVNNSRADTATLEAFGLRKAFSFKTLRTRKLAWLHIGHTGIKQPGLF